MGTSQRAFDQVKAILGKLDRSIDQVRERRIGGPAPRPAVAAAGAVGGASYSGVNPLNSFIGKATQAVGPNTFIGTGSAPATASPAASPAAEPMTDLPTSPPSASKWGRAQPIRRDGQG
jgi:hypothetical protein